MPGPLVTVRQCKGAGEGGASQGANLSNVYTLKTLMSIF